MLYKVAEELEDLIYNYGDEVNTELLEEVLSVLNGARYPTPMEAHDELETYYYDLIEEGECSDYILTTIARVLGVLSDCRNF